MFSLTALLVMREARPWLPAVLPADGEAVLGVLWEGNVDSDQRRAVLQSHTASDHSHTAEGGDHTKQQMTGCNEWIRVQKKEPGGKHDR